jgi:hypothetical protein
MVVVPGGGVPSLDEPPQPANNTIIPRLRKLHIFNLVDDIV